MYGSKGIGALYVRRKPRVRIEAQMHGGGHERGMRSGTLPTHQIVGMREAFWLARESMVTDNARTLITDGCLECGSCRIICNEHFNVDWEYPRGGHGILFKFG